MPETLRKAALAYHSAEPAGKLAIRTTKPCETQWDLGLAYTPGVAAPVREIAADPEAAYRYTAKGNLVGVITDGSAVLGLGKVGPLAGKPVMEGKAVLFKRFADIDVFDIEVQADSPEAFIETVAHIAPTFGGINLEDIAAPHCFTVEEELAERLDIPVFHDDQHGTAIIIAAGLLNALELQGKSLPEARIVCLGAGAAGIAAMRLLVALGATKERILLVDRKGVVHAHREDLNVHKREFAASHEERTLSEALEGADAFIGVSGPDLVTAQMLRSMAQRPVVFALANPDPEVAPALAHRVRSDLIMATGRTDYPNQVNNVLGFPFIFRGALDVRAAGINQAMCIAAVEALRALAHQPVPAEVLTAYGLEALEYGPDYIIPKPVDRRLIDYVAPAVAAAAVSSGVARLGYPAHYPSRQAGRERAD
jgi:malate dehydrogenase (oxaloacetate-decarboxylating)(NADP+)